MSNEIIQVKLNKIIDFKNGRIAPNEIGPIPIYGGNGILGHTTEANYENVLIIGRVGAYCGSVHMTKGKCWVSDNAIAGVHKQLESNEYNFYLLKCISLNKKQIGSSQPLLTQGILNDIDVKIYSDVNIRKKIASILSSLDSKIELNNRINAELEAMAKTLYDYWFVQFDFPDENGKPYKTSGGKMVWNDELKREIPEGWRCGELKDIANITMGQSPPGESYNEEGDGMIFFQGCTDFGNRFPTIRQYTNQPTRFAKEGEILLSVRAPVGTLNIANQNCCIGRGLAALNSKDNCIAYLFGVMKNLKQIFDRRNVDGTTFGSITKDDLFSLKVVRPAANILMKYNEAVSPAFEKQNKIELENQQLSNLRDWLLPMLMNGQVKVAEAAETLSMAAEPQAAYGTKAKATQ